MALVLATLNSTHRNIIIIVSSDSLVQILVFILHYSEIEVGVVSFHAALNHNNPSGSVVHPAAQLLIVEMHNIDNTSFPSLSIHSTHSTTQAHPNQGGNRKGNTLRLMSCILEVTTPSSCQLLPYNSASPLPQTHGRRWQHGTEVAQLLK